MAPSLSPQERIVYSLLFSNKTMKDIAYTMNISPKTVDTYARNVYRKYEVVSRIDLVIKVYQELNETLQRILSERDGKQST